VKNFDVTVTPNFAVKIGKGSSEWIIKEADVAGEYRFVVSLLTLTLTEICRVHSSGPAARPDLHASVESGGVSNVSYAPCD
jgi:hypothetical protein